MKAIPKSLNPDPYRKSTPPTPVGLRPPSFRTTAPPPTEVYKIVGVEVARYEERPIPAETPLHRPGIVIQASDRDYVTAPDGSIRRRYGGRQKPGKPETRQQAKARERIEAELQKRDRRRRERTLRHGLDDALNRAEKSRKHAEWLLEQVSNGKVIQPPRFGKRQALSEAERQFLAERGAVELRPEVQG